MAVKISQLPAAIASAVGDLFAVVQSGVTRQITLSQLAAGITGTVSSFLQAGTGAVARTMQSKERDWVSVNDFGADSTGTADSTAAIQAALAAHSYVVVPAGTYRIDGTIQAVAFKRLEVNGNLARLTAFSASTAPVIQINAQRFVVTGSGKVYTENASPEGVILFGSQNPSALPSQANVLWSKVEGIFIGGVQANGNIGVAFQSVEGWGAAEAVYQNWLVNCFIGIVGTGVYFGAQANANMMAGIEFYRINQYAVYFNGLDGSAGNQSVSENQMTGMFVNFSSSAVTLLKFVSASQNSLAGVQGEPGGTAQMYNFDANSNQNHLNAIDNCATGSVNLGTSNRIINSTFDFFNDVERATLFPGVVAASTAMPTFGATQAGAQALTGTLTVDIIQFSTEDWDTGGFFGAAGNFRFTPLVAGYYQVTAGITVATTATRIVALIYKNAGLALKGVDPGVGAAILTSTVSGIVKMNGTTDFIDFRAAVQDAQNSQPGAAQTYFQAAYVRSL